MCYNQSVLSSVIVLGFSLFDQVLNFFYFNHIRLRALPQPFSLFIFFVLAL